MFKATRNRARGTLEKVQQKLAFKLIDDLCDYSVLFLADYFLSIAVCVKP